MQEPLKQRYRDDPETALAALEVPVQGGTVTADGVLDFRGTLAVDRDAPVGFREISLRFELDAAAA